LEKGGLPANTIAIGSSLFPIRAETGCSKKPNTAIVNQVMVKIDELNLISIMKK
jgi:hypothetical protein